MLNTSDHAKIFSNVVFKNAILPDAIPEKDLSFLRNIVDYLYSQKEKYSEQIKYYSAEDDA